MNYQPGPTPSEPARIPEFLRRELSRIAASLSDTSPTVFYRTIAANAGTLSAAVSANWKIAAGNVIRLSASATLTLTGIAVSDPLREVVLLNVGTGVLSLKSEGTESSASYRFALAANWQLSANAAATLWYDPVSFRWRGISKT